MLKQLLRTMLLCLSASTLLIASQAGADEFTKADMERWQAQFDGVVKKDGNFG